MRRKQRDPVAAGAGRNMSTAGRKRLAAGGGGGRWRPVMQRPTSSSAASLIRLPPTVAEQVRYVLDDMGDSVSRTAAPLRHVWLGASADELRCQKDDDGADGAGWTDITIGVPISDGSVWQACDDASSCNYVLKVHFLTRPGDHEAAQAELAMLQRLQGSGLVPKLFRAQQCRDRLLLLLDRWDMDAETLGRRQFHRVFSSVSSPSSSSETGGRTAGYARRPHRSMLLYTENQLRQMFSIAQRLGEQGVAHDKLQPASIMYRVSDDRFFVAGLGLGLSAGPSRGRRPFEGTAMPAPAQRNVWQLLVALGADYPAVFVASEDPSTSAIRQISLLVGLGPQFAVLLPRAALPQIARACHEPDRELLDIRRHEQSLRTVLLRHLQPFWL